MNTLISPEYVEQNAALHAVGNYGVSGHKWAQTVIDFAAALSAGSILDYGAGRCTLHQSFQQLMKQRKIAWHVHWRNYDPAIPDLAHRPQPADLVVCGDVLEHVEPECIDAVLDDLQVLAKRAVFLVIATRPAKKTLSDGRNAHLIQEPYSWWLPKITERWDMINFNNEGGEFTVVGVAKSC